MTILHLCLGKSRPVFVYHRTALDNKDLGTRGARGHLPPPYLEIWDKLPPQLMCPPWKFARYVMTINWCKWLFRIKLICVYLYFSSLARLPPNHTPKTRPQNMTSFRRSCRETYCTISIHSPSYFLLCISILSGQQSISPLHSTIQCFRFFRQTSRPTGCVFPFRGNEKNFRGKLKHGLIWLKIWFPAILYGSK